MARFTAVSALVFLVGLVVAVNAPNSPFGLLLPVGLLGLAVAGAYYSVGFFRWLRKRLLWKVRNKLIISFSFVGLIPVLVLAGIAWFSITLIFRQLSVVFLEKEFDHYAETLHDATERIVLRYYESSARGERRMEELVRQEFVALADREEAFGGVVGNLLLRKFSRDQVSFEPVMSFPEAASDDETPRVPSWARDGFHGMVSHQGKLHFKSLLPIHERTREYIVSLDLPLDDRLTASIRRRTAINLLLVELSSSDSEISDAVSDMVRSRGGALDIHWAHVFNPLSWQDQVNATSVGHVAIIEVPLNRLYAHFFQGSAGGEVLVGFLLAMVGVFIFSEIVALAIGLGIARSITLSIHNIYAGARNIQAGNFDFRIPSKGSDQLDAMATAFNQMAGSVLQLMSQVSEKERLEKEIEIAREVQTHLFPRELPSLPRLQLAGTCLPARHVSGDYYDFIPQGKSLLDVVVADISGKGISAALLMASLQSSIRSHFVHQRLRPDDEAPIARAIGTINLQLYTHTAPEKFATMVLCRVDSENMRLTYCNAGHNPPLIVNHGTVRRMTVGGMVAGLFECPDYREETIQLEADDLVVFYTDGVVEAENPKGEQFEEDRLEDLVRQNHFLTAEDIRSLIISEVTSWADGHEQRDDITVVALKVGD